MLDRYRLPASALWIVVALLAAGPGHVQAAPLDIGGRQMDMQEPTPETPASREYRAGLQSRIRGDNRAAAARFDAALKLDLNYVPALIGQADLAQAQGDSKAAERWLQRADQAKPDSAALQLAWGRFHSAGRRPEAAEAAYKKAQALAPGALPPRIELGDLYLRRGRAAEALAVYREAVAQHPGNSYAQYGLGVAAAAGGQRDVALGAFDRAASLAPKDAAPLRAAGRLHLEAGAPTLALTAFDAALRRQPRSVALMLDRVDALAALGRWDDARAQCVQAEVLAPAAAAVQLKMADVFQGASRWPDAEERYLKAIQLDPRNPMAYNNLAWMTIQRQGDARKAVEWARQAVANSPGSSPFHDTLGWALRAVGDLSGAQASLKEAIRLEGGVAQYRTHLATVQRELAAR